MNVVHHGIEQQNCVRWPAEVVPVFERAMTCEYATLTQRRTPITYPVTPYLNENGLSLDVSTGVTYPAKAERARRTPEVALLFSDPVGSGLHNPPVVLVQGRAAVRDADLQGNTDRYLRISMAKLPETYEGLSPAMARRMGWYFTRIWIEVTPLRISWWLAGHLDQPPQVWEAPAPTPLPVSDPAPVGPALGSWREHPRDWHRDAARAMRDLGDPVLTVVTEDGYPLPFRVRAVALDKEGIRVEVPLGIGAAAGPACLTFHTHPERFTAQCNMVFVGYVRQDAAGSRFIVERQLADWRLPGSKLGAIWSFVRTAWILAPRARAEAQRRGQQVPQIRLPDKP